MPNVKDRKKLIEVALPLDAINAASAIEKQPFTRKHPRSIHIWWARRPLAAARAVIFSQLVDDPSEYVDVLLSDTAKRRKAESVLKARRKVWAEARATAEKAESAGLTAPTPGTEPSLKDIAAEIERERLFAIIRDLVRWENTSNEAVVQAARDEIWQSWRRICAENADHPRARELFDRHRLPPFHDPFAGGGALPLEAQRLGLESDASDLNPVAVLINKAMIEIPPMFAGRPPVNPEARAVTDLIGREWHDAQGLAEDVLYYGRWMRNEAEKRIGNLYPKMEVTAEMVRERPDLEQYLGQQLTVIAWLWARTVKSPNPAFAQVDVPLASTYMLSTNAGKEAYIEPVIEANGYRFTVKVGKPQDLEAAKNGTKLSRGANFQCLMSGTPIASEYIKSAGKAGRMGARLMAIVAEGDRGRVYLSPTKEQEAAVRNASPDWQPDVEFFQQALGFRVGNYGMTKWSDLFTSRQLVALTTFSDLVQGVRERVHRDGLAAGLANDSKPLRDAGTGAWAYAEAVEAYLAIATSRWADLSNTICSWNHTNQNVRALFSRQAIPMNWDYVELSPFSTVGPWISAVESSAEATQNLAPTVPGWATQADAARQSITAGKVVSTDPPYYDNVGYADLSDFFYMWLRHALRPVFPTLFATVTTPKTEELVATSDRHGGKREAESFFLDGMTQAMERIAEQAHPAFPITIYYAFKQAESDAVDGTASTGWETFLGAVIRAGFAVTGTWPMRTEREARTRSIGSNALASSIILVCRKQGIDAPTATRREFVTALKAELPQALAHLQRGNVAPVDLAQAAIGPGMAVYTGYSKVLDAQGQPLTVREALALINQTLDEALAEQEGDFDPDTRWALTWFEQQGFEEGEYGLAEQLSKSKNTSVEGMVEAGILESKRGRVRLLKPEELPRGWDPITDRRLTAWEVVHQLIRTLEASGEGAAGQLVAKLGAKAEVARELAYRLYNLCERKKRAPEALAYNGLVQSWPEIVRLARETARAPEQGGLFAELEA
jgi:putative DNA methylase